MEPRNWIGIIIILLGVILQPVGWMFVFWVQILSFVLITIGVFIFVTQKYINYKEEKEFVSRRSGSGMPGDIHENSGWGSGGRSESWSSEHGGQGGGGGGGD